MSDSRYEGQQKTGKRWWGIARPPVKKKAKKSISLIETLPFQYCICIDLGSEIT